MATRATVATANRRKVMSEGMAAPYERTARRARTSAVARTRSSRGAGEAVPGDVAHDQPREGLRRLPSRLRRGRRLADPQACQRDIADGGQREGDEHAVPVELVEEVRIGHHAALRRRGVQEAGQHRDDAYRDRDEGAGVEALREP